MVVLIEPTRFFFHCRQSIYYCCGVIYFSGYQFSWTVRFSLIF